jgi:hypothetical protein
MKTKKNGPKVKIFHETDKKKVVVLKNKYSGEIVETYDYNDVRNEDGISFIPVYQPKNRERIFLVNRDAFEIVTK